MDVTSSAQALRALEEPDQLDALIDRSHRRPVVIFKHSRTCGTSAQAYDELQSLMDEAGEIDVCLVDVLRHRTASQAVASRFGVRHESPQVLVVRDGQVAWHGSHYCVTLDAVRRAVDLAVESRG